MLVTKETGGLPVCRTACSVAETRGTNVTARMYIVETLRGDTHKGKNKATGYTT